MGLLEGFGHVAELDVMVRPVFHVDGPVLAMHFVGRLCGPQLKHHPERFVHHFHPVLVHHAEQFEVREQATRTDAHDETPR